jgi:hypothetical protein
MPALFAILIVLGVGLFIGSRYEAAHDAHRLFTSYRLRAIRGLSDWVKKTIATGLGIIGLAVALFLVYNLHVR